MTARKPVAPFYAVAVLWLAYALVFPLYRPLHFIVLIIASVVTFAAATALCRGEADIGEEKTEKPAEEKKEEKKETTGDPEVDKMLEDGRLAIEEMKRLDLSIEDAAISADIARLEQVSARIFKEVKADPKKGKQIRKFMDYYLPTTLKMVRGYRMLDERGITGQDAVYARNRIDDALLVVLQGCEKMLDKLYQDDVLDLTTDIDVLEQMLKRDGLSASDLEIAEAQAKRAAEIDAAANRIAREKAYDQKQQNQPTAQRQAAPQWKIDPRFAASAQAQMNKPDEQ